MTDLFRRHQSRSGGLRITNPAASLSVSTTSPRSRASVRRRAAFSLSRKIPKPSVSTTKASTADRTRIRSYFFSTTMTSRTRVIEGAPLPPAWGRSPPRESTISTAAVSSSTTRLSARLDFSRVSGLRQHLQAFPQRGDRQARAVPGGIAQPELLASVGKNQTPGFPPAPRRRPLS